MTRFSSQSPSLGLGLAFLALILLVACSGSDSETSVASDPAPAEQQVLRLRLTGEPRTIDPHLSSSVSETTLSKPLFAGLVTYDESLKVVPAVASELPTVDNGGISKDGLTYTLKLDRDAKWSDGKAVTADDFAYSMRRALDPKLAGPYSSFFYGIVGAREYNTALGTTAAPKTATDADLAALRDKLGVTVKDESTVVYQLTQANPSFLNLLALWTAYPVRQDVVEKFGNSWTEAGNHVGNGPFMLSEWAHNERIVLTPNPHWNGTPPLLQQLSISFIADDAAAFTAYLAGEIDATVVPPASRAEVLSPASELNSQLVRVAELSTFAFFMNENTPPFDNTKVRQAFGLAIDRNAYVTGVLQNGGRPTTSWIPPGMPGYNAGIGKQYEYNPARAAQLLAEAGYPNGAGLPKVTFMAVNNDTNRLTAQFLEDQLKKNLNIEVSTEFVESRVYTARLSSGQQQITLQRWSADWPYPDNWLPELFGSTGSSNWVGFKNAKFDDLVKRAAAETDEDKRLELYDEAHEVVVDEAGIMPIYNREVFLVVKPHVKDLIATGIDGGIKGDYFFHETYITAEQ